MGIIHKLFPLISGFYNLIFQLNKSKKFSASICFPNKWLHQQTPRSHQLLKVQKIIFLSSSHSLFTTDSSAQNIINQALYLGNPSVWNSTRDDCKWKFGNERDICPDPDINVILHTSTANGKNRGKLWVSLRPCNDFWCIKIPRELEITWYWSKETFYRNYRFTEKSATRLLLKTGNFLRTKRHQLVASARSSFLTQPMQVFNVKPMLSDSLRSKHVSHAFLCPDAVYDSTTTMGCWKSRKSRLNFVCIRLHFDLETLFRWYWNLQVRCETFDSYAVSKKKN